MENDELVVDTAIFSASIALAFTLAFTLDKALAVTLDNVSNLISARALECIPFLAKVIVFLFACLSAAIKIFTRFHSNQPHSIKNLQMSGYLS